MCRKLLIVVCSLWWGMTLLAQHVKVTKHISSADGLSNDFVTRLAIDGNGFVWAGTEAGVNRITGSRCTVFSTANGNRREHCTALYYHKASQQMMIGTEGDNLYAYDCRHGEMREIGKEGKGSYFNVQDMTASADGGVWLLYGNGLLKKLNTKTDEMTVLTLNERHASRCMMDDGKGWLYLGHSQHGMTMVELKSNNVRRFVHEPTNPMSLPGNNVRKIMMDSRKRIWVGTDQGLALFHPDSGTFDKVTGLHNDYDDNVYDICEMEDGSIWVALDLGGIKVVNDLHYDDTEVMLSSINARSIVCDEFGNAWVGNHSTGVDFISAEASPFHLLNYYNTSGLPVHVNSLCHDDAGYIWTGSEDELGKWQDNQLFGQWSHRGITRREHNYIRCMMADSQGYIWVGVDDQGVFRLNQQTGVLNPINIGHDGCDVHAFAEDERGTVWIGSEVGVFTYSNNMIQRQDNITQIAGNRPVTSFVWLDSGRMMVSTLGTGIHVIGGGSLDVNNGLPSNNINQVIKDGDTGLWLGTYEGLVHIKDGRQLEGIAIYDQRQGLADNHILALIRDGMGRVWMSTFSGISCFDPQTKHFYNFNLFDNRYLSGFSVGAVTKDYADKIYFASAQGVCYFNPDDFNNYTKVSQVQIVSCQAYNPVGSDTEILTLTPDEGNCVYAGHTQNTLRLLFAVRNAAQNGHEEYAYMMKGMNDHWYYIGNDQEVVFRSLAPGNYTFVLRAKLKEQDWENATETEIYIHIAPPIWKTWWACLIYLFVIGFGGWYVVRSYSRFRNNNHTAL